MTSTPLHRRSWNTCSNGVVLRYAHVKQPHIPISGNPTKATIIICTVNSSKNNMLSTTIKWTFQTANVPSSFRSLRHFYLFTQNTRLTFCHYEAFNVLFYIMTEFGGVVRVVSKFCWRHNSSKTQLRSWQLMETFVTMPVLQEKLISLCRDGIDTEDQSL